MNDHLKLSARIGAYGAISAIYLALIGMVESFGERQIVTGVISLGHTLLVINALAIGYLTAHIGRKIRNIPGAEPVPLPTAYALAGGALAGLITSIGLSLLVWVTDAYNIREVLVNASPTLVQLLTFGRSVAGGAVVLIVAGLSCGLIGGGLLEVPGAIRRPLVWGAAVVTLVGMLADLIRITLTRPGWPTTLSRFLISGQGVTPRGGWVVFFVTVALVFSWRWLPGLYRRVIEFTVTRVPDWLRTTGRIVITATLALRLLWFIGIDGADLPLSPDCAQALGNGAFTECLRAIGADLGDIASMRGLSLAELAPAIRGLITLTDTLALLAVATVVLFALIGVRRERNQIAEHAALAEERRARATRYTTIYLAAALLAFLPMLVGVFPSEVLVNIGLFVIMGFGINIVVGFAGLLDLGYVAFFAVGAYSTALLTSTASVLGLELSFWAALPLVFLLTALAGIVVGAPVLRMRGDYLAIVTLGLGEIARFLALSDWLGPWLGGAQGILDIPNPTFGGIEFVGPQKLYYLLLVGSLVALFVSWRLQDSRVGRALMAMREDEDVADAMGVNTVYYKLLAFAMGASIASFSGAVFAAKLGSIFPHSFNVIVSITVLSLLIIGGIGSLPGVVAGAVALVGIPELLREFTEFRLLIYGAALIVMMLVRPQGLLPSRRRGIDIRAEERAQDRWLKPEVHGDQDAAPAGAAD